MARVASLVLNRIVDRGHPCLIPDLRDEAVSLPSSNMVLAVSLHRCTLSYWGSSIRSSLGVSVWKRLKFSQTPFLHLLRRSHLLLVWCLTLVDFHSLNWTWIPGINATWSWYRIFLYVAGFGALVFYWGVLCVYF